MARAVTHRYVDPLAQVWIGAARRIGLTVVRTPDAYAATDGRGALAIGDASTLDADDSLGQMIFHELCHSLVEGEGAFARPDWGLDNTGPDDQWREHACLRVQWVLAGRHGLRAVFAPTTEYRALWDAFAGDVLADRGDRSVQAAIAGLRRAALPPWAPALGEALAATAQIAAAAARFATAPAATAGDGATATAGDGPAAAEARFATAPAATAGDGPAPSLWRAVTPPPAPHPTGLPAGDAAAAGVTCATCVWRHGQRGGSRCRQAGAKIDPAWPACERHESALDCQSCGACCRAAYHSVEVSRRDPAIKAHPELIIDRGSYLEIRRDGDRCAALHGGPPAAPRYHCAIYEERPRTCRDFTLGSEHCLTARRRVGLSL